VLNLNANLFATYLEGTIDSKKRVAYEAYFKGHDGEELSYHWSYDTTSLEQDPSLKNLINLFQGDNAQSNKEYRLWLLVGHQKKRFGDVWVKEIGKIFQDLEKI
jgi:hypothetical protein